MDALCEQQAQLTTAMSVISQQPTINHNTAPAHIQTNQDDTPMITEAQCNRWMNDPHVFCGKQMDAV